VTSGEGPEAAAVGVAALSRGSLWKYPYLSKRGLEATASLISESQLGCSGIIICIMQLPTTPVDQVTFKIINFHEFNLNY